MESETVDADFGELFDVVSWVGDVHVAVEVGCGQMGAEPLNNWGADGEVGDEMTEWLTKYPSMMSM